MSVITKHKERTESLIKKEEMQGIFIKMYQTNPVFKLVIFLPCFNS